jgi:hypothetical protein
MQTKASLTAGWAGRRVGVKRCIATSLWWGLVERAWEELLCGECTGGDEVLVVKEEEGGGRGEWMVAERGQELEEEGLNLCTTEVIVQLQPKSWKVWVLTSLLDA